jgi:hypothetical protein
VLDTARVEAKHRGRTVPLSLLAMALLVVVPVAWFAHAAGQPTSLRCTTAGQNTATAIDSIMRDARTHVEAVHAVAVAHGDTGGSFDSGDVYVDDVYVGVGTWFANFDDLTRGALTPQEVLQPVNALAQAVSVNQFPFSPPKENGAARFSQHCVTGP